MREHRVVVVIFFYYYFLHRIVVVIIVIVNFDDFHRITSFEGNALVQKVRMLSNLFVCNKGP